MSTMDLTFSVASVTLSQPAELIQSVARVITITNAGTDSLSGLGIYVQPTSHVPEQGYVFYSTPIASYEYLLTLGEYVRLGTYATGGLIVVAEQNDGSFLTDRVDRTTGYSAMTKIPLKDLGPNESTDLTLTLESYTGALLGFDLFIDLVVE